VDIDAHLKVAQKEHKEVLNFVLDTEGGNVALKKGARILRKAELGFAFCMAAKRNVNKLIAITLHAARAIIARFIIWGVV